MAYCVIFPDKGQPRPPRALYNLPPRALYKEPPQALNPSMRLFFGLQLDQQTCLAIDGWVTRTLPPLPHRVPVGNLHITLTFLGNVTSRRLERLCMPAWDMT
jgi:hypothetical protein